MRVLNYFFVKIFQKWQFLLRHFIFNHLNQFFINPPLSERTRTHLPSSQLPSVLFLSKCNTSIIIIILSSSTLSSVSSSSLCFIFTAYGAAYFQAILMAERIFIFVKEHGDTAPHLRRIVSGVKYYFFPFYESIIAFRSLSPVVIYFSHNILENRCFQFWVFGNSNAMRAMRNFPSFNKIRKQKRTQRQSCFIAHDLVFFSLARLT